jgi:hypothetical protein
VVHAPEGDFRDHDEIPASVTVLPGRVGHVRRGTLHPVLVAAYVLSALSLIPSSIRRIMAKSPNSMSTTPSSAVAGLVQS